MSNIPIDDAHLKEVCRPGAGEKCCRYLTMDAKGWSCEKNGELRELLDKRVADDTINAKGDNCEGRLSR